MVVRGQIWEYVSGSRQMRVLIISSDEYNDLPGIRPWGLRVERDAPMDRSGLLVQLGYEDPLDNAIVAIASVIRIDPTALRTNLGFVTESTMSAVERGLREFLVLPVT